MRNSTIAIFSLCIAKMIAPAHAAPLVVDGKPAAIVAVAADAGEWETLAAKDLIDYVEQISGAKLEQTTVAPDGVNAFAKKARKDKLTPIIIGSLAWPRLQKAIEAKSELGGTFALEATDDAVYLAGRDEGPYYAACELLEQQGVRWFMPGPLGTVVPTKQSLDVAAQKTVQAPSFPSRWFQMPNKEWQVRVRCGGPAFPGGHGLKGTDFKKNPEQFALIKGERSPRQHCLSNPELLKVVVDNMRAERKKGHGPIFGMGPNDGRGFCECEECKKLDGGDFDPFSFDPSVTDRYIWFFNRVLEELDADYPDTKIAFYIYHTYMRPPVRYKPNPRIMGALAPIALDRIHGFSNPAAPEKSYARWLYQEWGKIMPELYDRGYWSNLACPGFPLINIDRLRDEIPACRELGVKGWRVETFPNYASMLPANYVAARLMWDHTTDVDALLDDFAQTFFGPAQKPMLGYVKLMDAALRDAPNCTGSSWDMPYFYPPAVRKEARALLDEAAKLARSDEPYAARVRVVTESFDLLEAFIAMMDRRAGGDFVAAKAELDKLDAVAERMMAYEPVPMLSAGRFSTYVNYMKRFFRPCTEQGYARVTGGNRLAAMANDEWQFLIDPARVGESIGLFRPEITGGQWQTIKTSSSSWSNQGLRYYKGLAWYKQTLDVPAEFKGKRMFLWCGGVDEKAKVWLNGREIGISPGASFSPFEVDATEAVRPGERNVVVIAVVNDVVNELGTGGIVAPVMLYAPAKGKDAQLENLRPLGETFP
jgi:hypothetical protein